MSQPGKFDIYERTLRFAVRVARFVDRLPRKRSALHYGDQVLRSSSSVGANMREADGAASKKDFVYRIGISRKEANESHFWLMMIKLTELVTDGVDRDELEWLIGESLELKLILSAIIKNTNAK